MRVNTKEYKHAFYSAPTQNWRGGMNHAMHIIETHTLEKGDDYFIVDDKAWRDAMQILVRLPYSGRYVWEARKNLFRHLDNATKEEAEVQIPEELCHATRT